MRYCAACGSYDVAYVRVIKGYYRMECRYCGSPGPFELRIVSSEAREPRSAEAGRVTAGRPSLLTRRDATSPTASSLFGPDLVPAEDSPLGFTPFAGASMTGATGLEPVAPGLPDRDTRRRTLTQVFEERLNQAETKARLAPHAATDSHALSSADAPRLVPIWSERGPRRPR